MNQSQYNQLFSFIWNIATDVLVYAFEKGEYKKIIMPMMVLRRIDVLLEPTKEQLLKRKQMLDANNIQNQDPILYTVTNYPFYNTSKFTMKTLKSETDPLRLKMNFIDYLNGFSKDVQDIIDKFHLRQMVDNLTEAERLGSIIEKFTDDKINLSNKPVLDDNGNVRLPGLDNHTMGTIFEELLRKFNEENNVTEAGEHFTPRDYVKLLADLAVLPIADKITDNTYHIYDGACGTGGILTIAQDRILEIAHERGKNVHVNIFGQELQPDTFATCKADLMISENIKSFQYQHGIEPREYIAFDSTISRDGHAGETFDFCISNPPFGTPWKEDLKKRGLGENEKKKFTDSRFTVLDSEGKELSFIPDIGDAQMMFLANNLSRMREDTALGTRIVEVHNGSSLFTGDAGSGASNLRQYIIENDLLEAIIAMPEKDFYNTGIGTFIWVVTNRKEERRKGFVQLIDATEIKTPLRKNLGEKNCETSDTDRAQIMKLLMDFKETPQSKIFPNNEFGYWSVKVYQPQRDEQGNIVMKKGVPVIDKKSKDVEIIPFRYEGGIEGFFENEIKPYSPDAIIDMKSVETGYELSFTKYFYKPKQLRTIDEISQDIRGIEERTDGLLNEILSIKEDIADAVTKGLNPDAKMKDSGISWIGEIPEHWEVKKIGSLFIERREKVSDKEYPALSVSKQGITPQLDTAVKTDNGDNRKKVCKNDFVVNSRSDRKGSCGVSPYTGSVSLINIVLSPRENIEVQYFHHLFRSNDYIEEYYRIGRGIVADLWTTRYSEMRNIFVPLPPINEQQSIVAYIEEKCEKIDKLASELQSEIDYLKEYKQRLIADCVTGQVNVQNEMI
ncbi:N-6 DNA methylase [Xylanibacter brevis]|uniref:N-6 DNA methylase n=1 Tax=Xylanibacter brevis TaxID=83231 RepID=UPI000486F41D|nr:N-6 DNA methylase [Xylanibacter brevis]